MPTPTACCTCGGPLRCPLHCGYCRGSPPGPPTGCPAHSCPGCHRAQDRATRCKRCRQRAAKRWCGGCRKALPQGGEWACAECAAARDGRGVPPTQSDLVIRGWVSGKKRAREEGAPLDETLTTWITNARQAGGWKKPRVQSVQAEPTGWTGPVGRRVTLRPPPQVDLDATFHRWCPREWRRTLRRVLGPCEVFQVGIPAALPGAPPPVTHGDAGIPPHTVFTFAVAFGEADEQVGTAVVRGSHREGWMTGPTSRLPTAMTGFPGVEGRLELPGGSILLFDAAVLHRAPPAGPDPASRRTLFFAIKPSLMGAGPEAVLADDMGPQTSRFPVRD